MSLFAPNGLRMVGAIADPRGRPAIDPTNLSFEILIDMKIANSWWTQDGVTLMMMMIPPGYMYVSISENTLRVDPANLYGETTLVVLRPTTFRIVSSARRRHLADGFAARETVASPGNRA
ncbi:hypothetical protein [Rhodoglobus sp.]